MFLLIERRLNSRICVIHWYFKSSFAVTLILHCIVVVTSIVIFPFGIMVLIFYFCGHKCSGNENTEGMERKGREIKLRVCSHEENR